jgi:hypothetical protein
MQLSAPIDLHEKQVNSILTHVGPGVIGAPDMLAKVIQAHRRRPWPP